MNHTGSWWLYLNVSRGAELSVFDGGGVGTGAGSISVSALSTAVSGATLSSGSLGLGAASRTTDGTSVLNQSTAGVISGTGNAVVTLTLAFDIDTYTAGQVFGSGDGVCFRGAAAWGSGITNCSLGSSLAAPGVRRRSAIAR